MTPADLKALLMDIKREISVRINELRPMSWRKDDLQRCLTLRERVDRALKEMEE